MPPAASAAPVTTRSSSAQSATLRVIGPAVSRVCEIGTMPACDQRPVLGRRPTMPHSAAGMRTEPPVSEPMPPGAMRAPTATPTPPLEPPGMRVRSYGFRAAPKPALLLVMP